MATATAVVLLSGGIDSALNLALEARAGTARLALTIDYGQRAVGAELQAAAALAKYYNIEWRRIDLRWLGEINRTGLTRPDQTLPQLHTNELDDAALTQASMKAVWVANRNGVFLNVAASFAEAYGAGVVLAGFNREEAATFPDNSVAYMEALTHSFSFSTLNKVRMESHTKNLDKAEIYARALELDMPLELVWSCYEAGPRRCWTCESCKRTERGLLGQDRPGRQDQPGRGHASVHAGKMALEKMGWRG
jgi:7-cyano-7-deazaguanine synthase